MIPERVFVEGFLCYREAQEACFGGCALWMLAGANGSGKSALFDAVTFALYGQHRAGRRHAKGLINQACDALAVELDFRLDRRLYRARRTLTRQGRSTRQLYEMTDAEAAEGAGGWREIPETHGEQGFNAWVREHVALSYETFTASVLLLQGQAENLLSAGPARRHALLRQVVGLDRFERLRERADRHAAEARGAAGQLRRELTSAPRVNKRRAAAMWKTIQDAAARRQEAAARVQRLDGLLEQARYHRLLQCEQARLRDKIGQLTEMLGEQDAVETDHERWERIRSRLENLDRLAYPLSRLRDLQEAIERLEARKRSLDNRLALLDDASRRRSEELAEAERRYETSVARSERLTRRHAGLAVALPALEQLARARSALIEVRRKARDSEREVRELAARRKGLAGREISDRDVAVRRRAAAEAAARAAQAQAAAAHLEKQRQRFLRVADARKCPYCRQPLTPSRVAEERMRIEEELARAERRAEEAKRRLDEAETALSMFDERRSDLEKRRREIDLRISRSRAAADAAGCESQRLERLCAEAYDRLPAEYQRGAWPPSSSEGETADFPAPGDLEAIRRAKGECQRRGNEAAAESARRQEALKRLRAAARAEAAERKELSEQTHAAAEKLAEWRGDRVSIEKSCEAARSLLPADWRRWPLEKILAKRKQLRRERAALEAAGIESRRRDLQKASAERDQWTVQLDAVTRRIEEIPAPARIDPDALQEKLGETRRMRDDADREMRDAESRRAAMLENAKRRESLTGDLRRADRERHLWNRLAALLGRDGLQREILRAAEQAVVEYANVLLDRLAAGKLHLELRRPDRDDPSAPKTLDLLARTAASRSQLQEVAFLSGSQKFRVAVSLSLAIGQLASRTRRPVQAVIIDEGFGCLDAMNRQVMIQELLNLRGQLQRILLVSHEDEFAAAFPDGIRCELIDGASRLTPFHR